MPEVIEHHSILHESSRKNYFIFCWIICFKIKNSPPEPVEICWQKKEIEEISIEWVSFFWIGRGLAQPPAKI
jgi:hypothetical protein